MEEIQRARELVLRHGWNTTCYQILNPGFDLWFSKRVEGVIGYVHRKGVNVVAGAPVCAMADLEEMVQEWQVRCVAAGKRHCYFGAEERLRALTGGDPQFSTVTLGAQPVWTPDSFLASFQKEASLRAQVHRATNKGVSVAECHTDCVPLLRPVLENWLSTRGLPPLHFLVEPETLRNLMDRRIFAARLQGQIVAFLVLSPIPGRSGWLTEQFVRGRSAPNGTVELLLKIAAQTMLAEGAEFITMGIVPLSKRAEDDHANPKWLRFLASWAAAHGNRFYNFSGLDWFKNKFNPDRWDPVYVISQETKFSPSTLYAVVSAFTGSPPLIAVGRGAVRALQSEAHMILHRRQSGSEGS